MHLALPSGRLSTCRLLETSRTAVPNLFKNADPVQIHFSAADSLNNACMKMFMNVVTSD